MRVEDILRTKVLKFLDEKHIWHFPYTASTTWGMPDVFALYKGFFIGIELKREDGDGTATLLQEETVKSIQENGGLSAIIDTLIDVKMLIRCIDSGININDIWLTSS